VLTRALTAASVMLLPLPVDVQCCEGEAIRRLYVRIYPAPPGRASIICKRKAEGLAPQYFRNCIATLRPME